MSVVGWNVIYKMKRRRRSARAVGAMLLRSGPRSFSTDAQE